MKRLGVQFKDELSSILQIGEDNVELLDLFKNMEIEKLALITMGNSISTGFSFCDDNLTLFDRNVLLKDIYRSVS